MKNFLYLLSPFGIVEMHFIFHDTNSILALSTGPPEGFFGEKGV